MSLTAVPISLREANALVARYHRHHKPTRGMKFAIGCMVGTAPVGAVIAGRPVARGVDHRTTCEVLRLVTDGTPHACSFLYGRAARCAQAMGYRKIQTYILATEPGTSLKAAGWTFEAMTDGGDWNCASRAGRRVDQPQGPKQRWARDLSR